MQRIQRFARFWNLIVNSGHFIHTAPLIWQNADSPFAAFMRCSDWLYARTGSTGRLHMIRLARLLLEFLTSACDCDERKAAEALWNDYRRSDRPDVPGFLKKFQFEPSGKTPPAPSAALARQARHQRVDREP
jgi:hypothetical protein